MSKTVLHDVFYSLHLERMTAVRRRCTVHVFQPQLETSEASPKWGSVTVEMAR